MSDDTLLLLADEVRRKTLWLLKLGIAVSWPANDDLVQIRCGNPFDLRPRIALLLAILPVMIPPG